MTGLSASSGDVLQLLEAQERAAPVDLGLAIVRAALVLEREKTTTRSRTIAPLLRQTDRRVKFSDLEGTQGHTATIAALKQ